MADRYDPRVPLRGPAAHSVMPPQPGGQGAAARPADRRLVAGQTSGARAAPADVAQYALARNERSRQIPKRLLREPPALGDLGTADCLLSFAAARIPAPSEQASSLTDPESLQYPPRVDLLVRPPKRFASTPFTVGAKQAQRRQAMKLAGIAI